MKNQKLMKTRERVQISVKYVFTILAACFAMQTIVNAQSVMRADTERVSNVGPLKAKMISSSIIRSHRFHGPFLLRNVNPAGDQFGFDQSLNTLNFYIDRMGTTNSRDQLLYIIVNNASVDYVKAIRETSQYDETYFVRSPEVIPMPEHWHIDPLGDWLPFPINTFLQKHAPAYNLGSSNWSDGVGVEIKFSSEIKKDLLITIVAVNPNRSKRDIERLMNVPFSTMLNLVKYLGESSYSDYVSFVNYHLEYNAAHGGTSSLLAEERIFFRNPDIIKNAKSEIIPNRNTPENPKNISLKFNDGTNDLIAIVMQSSDFWKSWDNLYKQGQSSSSAMGMTVNNIPLTSSGYRVFLTTGIQNRWQAYALLENNVVITINGPGSDLDYIQKVLDNLNLRNYVSILNQRTR